MLKSLSNLTLILGLVVACSSGGGNGNPTTAHAGASNAGSSTAGASHSGACQGSDGDERCACYHNGTCNAGLVCLSDLCVTATAANGGANAGFAGANSGGSNSGGANSAGSSAGGDATGGTTNTGGDNTGGSTASDPSSPVFLSFGTTTPIVDNGHDLIMSALLTDPDGIADLIGGTLLDPDTGASYGVFGTTADEGAYSISVPWDQINAIASINGDPPGVDRTFRAQFFDVAGHSATRDVTVTLRCWATYLGDACCDGVPTQVTGTDDLCGACDAASSCYAGTPPAWAEGDDTGFIARPCDEFRCTYYTRSATPISCDEQCASHQAVCVDRNYSLNNPALAYYGDVAFPDLLDVACNETPPATSNNQAFLVIRCLCGAAPPAWYSQLP